MVIVLAMAMTLRFIRTLVILSILGGVVALPRTPLSAQTDDVPPLAYVTSPAVSSVLIGGGSTSSARFAPGGIAPAQVQDITGLVIENGSALDQLRVQIRHVGGTSYWNGSDWQVQPVWVFPDIVADTWTVPSVDLTQERSYQIAFSASDLSGNSVGPNDSRFGLSERYGVHVIQTIDDVEDPMASFHFSSLPAFRVLQPDGSIEEPGETITIGTHDLTFNALDNATGISRVRVQIRHVDTAEYWSGVAWQTAPVWVPGEPSGQFRPTHRTSLPVNFDRVGAYWVSFNVTDGAGNIATPVENERIMLSTTADTTAPVAETLTRFFADRYRFPDGRVITPNRRLAAGPQDITGFATDVGLGVDWVQVQIERRQNGQVDYLDRSGGGDVWIPTPTWNQRDLTETADDWRWRVDDVSMDAGAEYVVRVSAQDLAGNRSKARDNVITFLIAE